MHSIFKYIYAGVCIALALDTLSTIKYGHKLIGVVFPDFPPTTCLFNSLRFRCVCVCAIFTVRALVCSEYRMFKLCYVSGQTRGLGGCRVV